MVKCYIPRCFNRIKWNLQININEPLLPLSTCNKSRGRGLEADGLREQGGGGGVGGYVEKPWFSSCP